MDYLVLGIFCFVVRGLLALLAVVAIVFVVIFAFDFFVVAITMAALALAGYLLVESFGVRQALSLGLSSPVLAIRCFPCILVGACVLGLLIAGAALFLPLLALQFLVWRLLG